MNQIVLIIFLVLKVVLIESALASCLSSLFRTIYFFILKYIKSIFWLTSSSSFWYCYLFFVSVRNQKYLFFQRRFTFNWRTRIIYSIFLFYRVWFFTKSLNYWRICFYLNIVYLITSCFYWWLRSLKWLLFGKFRSVIRSTYSHTLFLSWSWCAWNSLRLLLVKLVLTNLIFAFANHMALTYIFNSTQSLVSKVFYSTSFALTWIYNLNIAAIWS